MYFIPQDTLASLEHYVNDRWPPGGFLTAVLSNDLETACAKADEANRAAFFDIVNYVFNEVPWAARGSVDKVRAWLGYRPAREPEGDGL